MFRPVSFNFVQKFLRFNNVIYLEQMTLRGMYSTLRPCFALLVLNITILSVNGLSALVYIIIGI